MATSTLVSDHQAALDDLTRVATRDVVTLWRQTADLDARTRTSVLVDYVPDLTDAYGDVAAMLAVDHYDESRAAAGAPGRYRAAPAPLAPAEQVEVMVRWAVTPIWSTEPAPARALERLAAGADRLIRLPGRHTIRASAAADPEATGSQRVTRPDACGFCLLVATRTDHLSLTLDSPGRWHTHCRCGETPTFGPGRDDYPDPADLYAEWLEVTEGLSGAAARQEWDRHRRSLQV